MTLRELILMTGLYLAVFLAVAYLTRAKVRRMVSWRVARRFAGVGLAVCVGGRRALPRRPAWWFAPARPRVAARLAGTGGVGFSGLGFVQPGVWRPSCLSPFSPCCL